MNTSTNPKSEIRNPKESRNPKSEKAMRVLKAPFRISVFGFLSDFGIRISDFRTVFALVLTLCGTLLHAQSFFPQRPDDPRAVDFTRETFGAHADGLSDDADALQQAINRVQETRAGVVLIPEGRYRLSKTVYVWQGIRLIGYGQKRPVFVLGRNTPGFQDGAGKY